MACNHDSVTAGEREGASLSAPPSVRSAEPRPLQLGPKNSILPTEHTTADRAVVGPVHEGISDSALVISGEVRGRWISEQEAWREPTYTASAEDYARVHSSADSAGDGPEREYVTAIERVSFCAHQGCSVRVIADGEFCGSHVHRGADSAREVRDA